MKTIYFTLNEIETATQAHSKVSREMGESYKTGEQAYRVIYDQFLKAIARTTEDLRRAQKDKSLVASAIATTEEAIDKLQAIADAPAPEGQEKPPPPKDLAKAKKNLVRLKAIQKEVTQAIKTLETQLYQQDQHKKYLMNAFGYFYNAYNLHSGIVQGVVSSANSANSAARGAMYALGAGSSSRMECSDPSYLTRAAESIEDYANKVRTATQKTHRSAVEFTSHLKDNVSRNASAEYKSVTWTIDRQVEQTRSRSGRLRQAAGYLKSYLSCRR